MMAELMAELTVEGFAGLMAESMVDWMVALRVVTMGVWKGENLVASLVVTMVAQLVD